MNKIIRYAKLSAMLVAVLIIGWCWKTMPSEEERIRSNQITAQVTNAELVLYASCTFGSPAPFLKITLDREVDFAGGWPSTNSEPVKTNTFYVLLGDYFYRRGGHEGLNYKQILESKTDGPRVWNTRPYEHKKDKCGDLYLLELHWDPEYQ